MPPDDAPQPLDAPVLTHVRFEWNGSYPNGWIHLNAKDNGGKDQKTIGYVRGTGITKGVTTVTVQKGDKKKVWEGTVTAGPYTNDHNQEYWDFEVVNTKSSADPDQDDTITVTITNPGPQTSTSLPADPQPSEIP